MTLSEHLAEFPYSVFIPEYDKSVNDERAEIRHAWLRALPDSYKRAVNDAYGWSYSKSVTDIYRTDGNPYRYVFKDEKTAMEFKLRFG